MVKNPAPNVDVGSIPGSGRSPGGGNGNPLQYSCLENPTDRGAWRAAVHIGRKESDIIWQLNNIPTPVTIVAVIWLMRKSRGCYSCTYPAKSPPTSTHGYSPGAAKESDMT